MKKQMILAVVGLSLGLAQAVFADDTMPNIDTNATMPTATTPESAEPANNTNSDNTTNPSTNTDNMNTDDMNKSTSAPQPVDQ